MAGVESRPQGGIRLARDFARFGALIGHSAERAKAEGPVPTMWSEWRDARDLHTITARPRNSAEGKEIERKLSVGYGTSD